MFEECKMWRDINVPFEELMLRVQLKDSDKLTSDDVLGQISLPLKNIDRASRNSSEFKTFDVSMKDQMVESPRTSAQLREYAQAEAVWHELKGVDGTNKQGTILLQTFARETKE